MIENIILVLAVLGSIPALLFPIVYHTLTKGSWRKSAIGYDLMFFTIAVAVLLVLSVVRQVFGMPDFWYNATRIFALVTAAGMMWSRLLMLIFYRSRHDDHR